MSTSERNFLPEITNTSDGAERRVGIELEFIGPEAKEVAAIVAQQTNGKIREVSEYEYVIEGDAAGDWKVELDYQYLRELGRKNQEQDEPTDILDEMAESALRLGASVVVPIEIVGPPLPLSRMPDYQTIVKELHATGARGTDDSFAYAFGLQFNPELPKLDAATILAYLRAFLVLQDWLFERSAMDTFRKLTQYAEPFGADYAGKLVDWSYEPAMSELIDDYLDFNPTRNRALDLLPLFMHIDKDRLRKVVDDPRVKPRPTFHYRLPNSDVGNPDWTIFSAWSDWLVVEWLANSDSKLEALCELYEAHLGQLFGNIRTNWTKETEEWLAANR